MKCLHFTLLEDGSKKLLGIFKLSFDGKKVLYYRGENKTPITRDEFVNTFGEGYINQMGETILLSNPKEYLKNLKYRWSGYTWVEIVE